ncbi:aspartate kinase [Companilactobacillus musae]|uniref:aspartate kinase n=1 Tax=Companilactobacillus musae TaxID=1903258 RepID=UPI000E64DF70|nr:aspartate kinase [Companilactobacillus musae]
MKVAKFGGSSVADAEQFRKVKQIIYNDAERKVVVVSAAGKSQKEPVKITDMLIALEQAADTDKKQLFQKIAKRILKIKADLKLSIDIRSDLNTIQKSLQHCSHDYLISRGEYLTAKLMADYLGFYFVDAKDVLVFNDDLDYVESGKRLKQIMLQHPNVVVPGFYGANNNGTIHLMPRGGSDISGAILANLLDANLYENWTDVSGILMADPRIISHSKRIEKLTYDELQALSYMGIGVFQEEAVRPVWKKQIPTAILNTNCPESGGTLVVAKLQENSDHIVTGIAGGKDYTVITIQKYQLNKHIEVLQKVLESFQKLHIVSNYVPSGNDGFSFVCQKQAIGNKLNQLIADLTNNCGVDSVDVNQNIALVAAVSLQFSQRPAMAGKILNYLDNSLIKVRFVFQEGSDIKVVFGVANADYERTINRIYHESMDYHRKKISA